MPTKLSGRRYARKEVSVPVEIDVDKKITRATSVNIGFGGIYLTGAAELPLDALVVMTLELPGGPKLSISGKVVRTGEDLKGPHGAAVRLFGNGRAERRAWVKAVQELVI